MGRRYLGYPVRFVRLLAPFATVLLPRVTTPQISPFLFLRLVILPRLSLQLLDFFSEKHRGRTKFDTRLHSPVSEAGKRGPVMKVMHEHACIILTVQSRRST